MIGRRPNRAQLFHAVEWTLWIATVLAVLSGGHSLMSTTGNSIPKSSALIPIVRHTVPPVDSEAVLDSAIDVLSRDNVPPPTRVANQSAINPVPVVTLPPLTLRGIVWTPRIAVLLEGAGLPSGGAIMNVDAPRGELRVTAVRGDTAFVRNGQSSLVLPLRSRNQPPE